MSCRHLCLSSCSSLQPFLLQMSVARRLHTHTHGLSPTHAHRHMQQAAVGLSPAYDHPTYSQHLCCRAWHQACTNLITRKQERLFACSRAPLVWVPICQMLKRMPRRQVLTLGRVATALWRRPAPCYEEAASVGALPCPCMDLVRLAHCIQNFLHILCVHLHRAATLEQCVVRAIC